MPLHIGDYLADTGHLGTAQHGAYLLLIMHYWRNGGVPDNDRQLASIARLPLRIWQDIRPVIEAFFQPGWKHKRIDDELRRAELSYERRANAGKRGGKAKAETRQCSSNARPPPEQCSSNLEPITKNQEPEEEFKEEKEPRVSALAASGWPPDFREQFWGAYPHKVGKADAIRKLERAAGKVSFDALMAALFRYANKTDDRPWANPATWIHQERWTDQPAMEVPNVRPTEVRPQTDFQRRQDDGRRALDEFRAGIERLDDGGGSGDGADIFVLRDTGDPGPEGVPGGGGGGPGPVSGRRYG